MAAKPIRLLLSSRDANGALQVAPLWAEAQRRRGLEATLVADGIALEKLRALGLPVAEAGVPVVPRGDLAAGRAAIARASALLERLAPDAIVSSLSGPVAGVDEALVAAAPRSPTFVLQDFWGDLNRVMDAEPYGVFVLDAEAEALTRRRCRARTFVTGMPKFEAYARLSPPALRAETRRALGIGDAATVFAFFGQPMWDTPGYRDAAADFVRAARAVAPGAYLLVRRHPRDASGELDALARYASEACGLACRAENSIAVENVLAAADAACAAFSSCCHDAIMLGRASPAPLGVAIYFLPPPVAATYRAWTGLDDVPPVRAGLALLAGSGDELAAQLRRALGSDLRRQTWERVRAAVPPVEGASARILDAVVATVAAREHAA